MRANGRVTRRTALRAGAGAALAAVAGGAGLALSRDRKPEPRAPAPAPSGPLWKTAQEKGLVFGTAYSTRLGSDARYVDLVDREAALLFSEDDLLWWRLKPRPGAPLDFTYADRFVDFAQRHRQLVFGAHLVWDEGFGDGWSEDDLWAMDERTARRVLFGTLRRVVKRYRGQVAGWIVVNEAIDAHAADGLRADVPWYASIGPSYIRDAFHLAREADPHATLVLNDFGFETDAGGDPAVDRRRSALTVVDALLADGAPVDAFGVQAHLSTDGFAEGFDPRAYRRFLAELADRGLDILLTELDVLDDGLEPPSAARDRAVGDVYARYLDAALAEPAVKAVMAFGLSDRYTWLQEDYPRDDGAPRRPLPYDERLRPKPAYRALRAALGEAPRRRGLWRVKRS